MVALSISDSLEQWKESIRESRHSKYPVCGDSLDDIIGVLDTKDYFMRPLNDQKQIIETVVDKAMLIPESMKANSLFRKMQENREYFAVVIDEYGGMSGIVTC